MPLLKVHVGDAEYDYDPAKVDNVHVRAIERFTKKRFSVFQDTEIVESDEEHTTVLVWLGRVQAGEDDLDINTVRYPYGSAWLEVIDDPTEEAHPDAPKALPTPVTELNGSGKKTGSGGASKQSSAA